MRISRKRFKPKPIVVSYELNERIRYPQLRIVTDGGEHLGIMTTQQALEKAREMEQDLVVIQPKAEPPVAKIIDFGKFKYEKAQEIKEQKAKQTNIDIKGIRLSVRIGQHDLDVRREQARKFLEDGDKIRVEIILRGREKRHGDLAGQIIRQFVDSLKQEMPLREEQPLNRLGGQLTTIFGKA